MRATHKKKAREAHIIFYNEGTDKYKGDRGQEHNGRHNPYGFEHLDHVS
jgi:hypothetical protein